MYSPYDLFTYFFLAIFSWILVNFLMFHCNLFLLNIAAKKRLLFFLKLWSGRLWKKKDRFICFSTIYRRKLLFNSSTYVFVLLLFFGGVFSETSTMSISKKKDHFMYFFHLNYRFFLTGDIPQRDVFHWLALLACPILLTKDLTIWVCIIFNLETCIT